MKIVAISTKTLNFLISKVEIVIDNSQDLGEEQMIQHMSKSLINLTVCLLATHMSTGQQQHLGANVDFRLHSGFYLPAGSESAF